MLTAATAAAQNVTLPEIQVISTSPLPGAGIDRDKVPAMVQTLSSGPREVTRTTLVSGTSTGRFVSMCGQIGVIQIAGTDGKIIGPPADSE